MKFTIKFEFQKKKYSVSVEASSHYAATVAFEKLILSKLIIDSIEGEQTPETPPKNPFDSPDLAIFKDIFGIKT